MEWDRLWVINRRGTRFYIRFYPNPGFMVSMMELETPNAPTRGLLSWVELQTPELGEATQTTQLVAGRPMQGTIVYLMQLVGAVKKITRE